MWYIYKITNLLNDKNYIGQHKYHKGERIRFYFGSGKIIQEALKKYGRKNFKKEILIENIETQKEADRLEQLIIEQERKNGKAEYNISPGGQGGRVLPDDSKFYEEKRKPVICLETGEIFNSIKEVGIKKKLDSYNIGAVCIGKRDSFHGFHWAFYEKGKKYSNSNLKKPHFNKRPVICIETQKVYKSIKEATRETNIKSIGSAVARNIKAGGYHWEYYDKNKDYTHYIPRKPKWYRTLICIETGELFESFNDAAKKTGIPKTNIAGSVKNHVAASGLHFDYYIKGKIYVIPKNKLFNTVKCLETGKIYKNIAEAAKLTGIGESAIRHNVKKRTKSAKGFHFIEIK